MGNKLPVQPQRPTVTRTLARLSQEDYLALEKAVVQALPNSSTTPLQGGVAIGVEHVLRIIRNGWVIGL